MSSVIGFDFETHRIGESCVIPPAVCMSVWSDGDGDVRAAIEPEYDELLKWMLDDQSLHLVAHNASFDLAAICFSRPDLISQVWKLVCDDRRVSCTIIREKLLHLTTHGNLEYLSLPDGSTKRLAYSLADLVMHYFGEDISAAKDENDSWRVNYSELATIPASKYPEDAYRYALDDAMYACNIWHEQEQRRQQVIAETGVDPFAVEKFRVAADFALTLVTAWGMATDPQAFAEIQAMLAEALKPENTALLVQAGILRPAVPPRPYKNGATNPDGTPKMTAGSAESVDTKAMRAYMLSLKERYPKDVVLRRTPASERHPDGQLSFDGEWLEDHWHLDPVIEQFYSRQKLQKLVTTELPRMMRLDADGNRTDQLSPVVHPCFDVLKRTGRTSSYASSLYPSFNCQNVDPRARGCYVARPGYVLLSVDYSQMELGTLGQTCLNLFGHSVIAEKINAGDDLHAFLGGSIAYNVDSAFRKVCDDAGAVNTDDIYRIFAALKAHEDEKVRDFYAHFRKLAKPTGLGYPGGLMPPTFVKYAKATYGEVISLETAEMLREVWMAVFPEMEEYFAFIKDSCEDAVNSPRTVRYIDEDGVERVRQQPVFAYSTPMGMYRAGCDYCAVANGLGLQSPSAEGAIMAVINVSRGCLDPKMSSILYDDDQGPVCRLVAFVHDELILEIREDEYMHERASAVAEIMVDCMRIITPDVSPRAEMALMRRWDKKAAPVYDESGRLTVWEPDPAK